jgi:alpha 1,2-mannosyltransferase
MKTISTHSRVLIKVSILCRPGVKFFCNINHDPFLVLADEGKVYGFTISLYEFSRTITTLWQTTKEFIEENPQYIHPDNAMKFLSDDGGNTYNLCHCAC